MAQVFQIEVELRSNEANCGPSIYTSKEVSYSYYAVQVGHSGERHIYVHFAIIAIYPANAAIMPLHKINHMTVCNKNIINLRC